MKNKDFENLFNNVKPVLPSDALKERVLKSAAKIPVIEKPINRFFLTMRRYGAVLSALVLTLIASITLLGFYSESYYEVYLDVNPSIEVEVNRFGVVSGVNLINDDAKDCLKGISLKGRSPEEAVTVITTVLSEKGYFSNDAELFISGYSGSYKGITQTIEALYYRLTDLTEQQGYSVEVFTGAFTEDQRKKAAKENISPLKYSIICEVLALDDSYTLEKLSDLSMARLNNLQKSLVNYISEEDIETAHKQNISPMRYELYKTLTEFGCDMEEITSLSTVELKSKLNEMKASNIDKLNKDIEEEAVKNGFVTESERAKFNVIYSIMCRDSSYTVESLRDKTMLELMALDYALEKYDVLKDLFG